jgi:isocitrate/isopropylmalate dehydrogenase
MKQTSKGHLLILPGDGIGTEIAGAAERVLAAADCKFGLGLTLTRMDIGFAALAAAGTTIPDPVIEAAKQADGVVLGPVSHNEYPPVAEGGRNPSGVLRSSLGLYANIRPARSRQGVPRPTGKSIDLIVVRENLEGFYADRNMYLGTGEFMPEPGVALAFRKITAVGSRRIAERAFAIAAERPDPRVSAIHKANVMRITDGLFLAEVRKVARSHPGIAYDEILVDASAAYLIRSPERFDVIVTTNMFGDILSDLASEISGGLGLAASLNVGEHHAVAQAQHGSAPDIAGKGIANPVSLINSAAMLLRHLGHALAAEAIEAATDSALTAPETRTRDLGGELGTMAFAEGIAHSIEKAAQ